eukprot:1156762-Pelagomonas_calceolata.AAC.5
MSRPCVVCPGHGMQDWTAKRFKKAHCSGSSCSLPVNVWVAKAQTPRLHEPRIQKPARLRSNVSVKHDGAETARKPSRRAYSKAQPRLAGALELLKLLGCAKLQSRIMAVLCRDSTYTQPLAVAREEVNQAAACSPASRSMATGTLDKRGKYTAKPYIGLSMKHPRTNPRTQTSRCPYRSAVHHTHVWICMQPRTDSRTQAACSPMQLTPVRPQPSAKTKERKSQGYASPKGCMHSEQAIRLMKKHCCAVGWGPYHSGCPLHLCLAWHAARTHSGRAWGPALCVHASQSSQPPESSLKENLLPSHSRISLRKSLSGVSNANARQRQWPWLSPFPSSM